MYHCSTVINSKSFNANKNYIVLNRISARLLATRQIKSYELITIGLSSSAECSTDLKMQT